MSESLLQAGQWAEMHKTVSESDVAGFATISGDFNPVHMDEAVAAKSRFGGRIAHGMLSAGFISACLAMQLPGPGSIYLGQTLSFKHPVRIGDTITTKVEVLEWNEGKRRARLATTCRNQQGEIVIEGEALVMVPREEMDAKS